MLLKPAKQVRLCSAHGLHHTTIPRATASLVATIYHHYRPQGRFPKPARSPQWRQHRSFATVLHGDDPYHRAPKQERKKPKKEPPRWPANQTPTPYDIFHLARNGSYSKARFFELVMLYHPDRRHTDSTSRLTGTARLERYRLVVAANEILCNPTKRRAYDLYGLGWGEPLNSPEQMRRADKAYREDPESAANNATWEDWERWREQKAGKKQEPIFMSNGGFVMVLCFFVLVGVWGQVTRAGSNSLSLVEIRDQSSQQVGDEMRKRISESAQLDRDERVEQFLRQREGWGYETVRPALPPPIHPKSDDSPH